HRLDRGSAAPSKLLWRARPPDPGVPVQNDHRSTSHSPRIGPKMSPRTVTLPRSDAAGARRAGTTRATALPLFVMSSDSPVSATGSSKESHRALNAAAPIVRSRDMTIACDLCGYISRRPTGTILVAFDVRERPEAVVLRIEQRFPISSGCG